MRLIHRHDRESLGINFSQIESVFFAAFKVRRALQNRQFSPISGLDVCSLGSAWSQQEILKAVERGDLLLVTDEPFSPLSDDTSGNYSHITNWAGSFHKSRVIEPPPQPNQWQSRYQSCRNPASTSCLKASQRIS